jgi:hypothetical protein
MDASVCQAEPARERLRIVSLSEIVKERGNEFLEGLPLYA